MLFVLLLVKSHTLPRKILHAKIIQSCKNHTQIMQKSSGGALQRTLRGGCCWRRKLKTRVAVWIPTAMGDDLFNRIGVGDRVMDDYCL